MDFETILFGKLEITPETEVLAMQYFFLAGLFVLMSIILIIRDSAKFRTTALCLAWGHRIGGLVQTVALCLKVVRRDPVPLFEVILLQVNFCISHVAYTCKDIEVTSKKFMYLAIFMSVGWSGRAIFAAFFNNHNLFMTLTVWEVPKVLIYWLIATSISRAVGDYLAIQMAPMARERIETLDANF